MEHRYWEEKLHGYLDDVLEPADRLAVQQHIAQCEDCGTNLSYFESMKQRLRVHARMIEVPPMVQTRLVRLFERKRGHLRRLWLPGAGIGLAAALLIAFILPMSFKDPYRFVDRVMEGEVICHDCMVADKAGLTKGDICHDGHRMGLQSQDSELWRFASDREGSKIMKQTALMGKQVRVVGQVLSAANLIRIRSLKTLGEQTAFLIH